MSLKLKNHNTLVLGGKFRNRSVNAILFTDEETEGPERWPH